MQAKSKMTQQRILSAARELFFEQGIAETTQQQISDAAGINRGLIFHYFKTKESIAALLFEEYIQNFFQRMRECSEQLTSDPLVGVLITERILFSLPRQDKNLAAFFSEIIRAGLVDSFLQQQEFELLSYEARALPDAPDPKKLRVYAGMLASLSGYLLSTDFVAQHGISPDFALLAVRDIHMNLLNVAPERRAALSLTAETLAGRISVSPSRGLFLLPDSFTVSA